MNTHPFPSLTDTPPKLKGSKIGLEYVALVHKEKAKVVTQPTEVTSYYPSTTLHYLFQVHDCAH